MKVLLIHTDGYSIDVVGKYNTKEEACKQLNFEYERKIEYQEMFSNGIDSEWMKSSHCDFDTYHIEYEARPFDEIRDVTEIIEKS